MWGVKIEQTEDGRHYVAGIGLSMEDTEEGKLSQFPGLPLTVSRLLTRQTGMKRRCLWRRATRYS